MITIKLAGGILVLISASLIGFNLASRGGRRIDNLNEMKKALTLLKGEIRFALTPFGEAAASISERLLPPVSEIFSNASNEALRKNATGAFSIWETAIKSVTDTYFTKEDISAFISMGKNLGFLDKEMQLKSIDLLLEYIDETINKISENREKESRMYRSLGVLSGLLIIVMMI